MKSPKIIALLLLLNLGLFAAILSYVLRARLVSPISAEPVGADSPLAARRPQPTRLLEKVGVVTNQFRWAQLESEDYKVYIARLRSIGCPEPTIRDIIIADLDKLLAPEITEATGRRKELKYWHPEEEEMLNDVDPRQLFRKEREIDKRKREIIRELIQADLARERMKASGEVDYYERRLSFLPENRRTQVRELLEQYDEAEQKLRDQESADDGGLSAPDRAQVRALRQERAAAMERLLAPQEKEQYELWLSPTANEVRHALYGMDATEEEFLAVYQARKSFEDPWGQRDPDLLDGASRQQMEQARAEMEAQIARSFGEQRYAEYQRGQDDDFHLLSALVTRFQLPREKAAEAYGYKTVALNYREQVRNNPQLTPQQKEEALKAITEETKKAVRGVLGVKAYNYYLRTGQGQWIGE
ncbi:MAG: hypothetical protein DME25_01940 [Verrucomicrobia bacterium]|nr:MAG: hypothetical protein DME25_01940 [Verrucomicrobiota bacterium]